MVTQTTTATQTGHARKANRPKITTAIPAVPVSAGAQESRAAISVRIDGSRDVLLTDFGRATLVDRYLLAGETPQDLFARVARAYADDGAHAQRLYDYMSKLWF